MAAKGIGNRLKRRVFRMRRYALGEVLIWIGLRAAWMLLRHLGRLA